MVVSTWCQKWDDDSAPSTTEEAATDLLGHPEPPAQDLHAQDHPKRRGE